MITFKELEVYPNTLTICKCIDLPDRVNKEYQEYWKKSYPDRIWDGKFHASRLITILKRLSKIELLLIGIDDNPTN